MIKEKAILRKQMLARRNAISLEEKKQKSAQIFERLQNLSAFQKAKSVFLYDSFANEVETGEILAECVHQKKQIYLPRIFPNGQMQALPWQPGDALFRNIYGILEPMPQVLVKEKNIDLALVPGVAFGKEKSRLGFGKGYYDAWLCKHSKTIAVGLAYEFQLLDALPKEPHDRKMDVILTEEQVFE